MTDRTAAGYDAVAHEYAARYAGELDHKPFDRAFLDRFAALLPAGARVLDLGCGPGHVGRYVHDRGPIVQGIDVSSQMVAAARTLNPGMVFAVGDMRNLDLVWSGEDGPVDGVVAFYSIVHFRTDELVPVFRGIRGVLRPNGLLALTFHVGEEVRHVDSLLGVPTDLEFRFFPADVVAAALVDAGFEIVERREREPYAPAVEAQTQRCYVLARRAGSAGGAAAAHEHRPATRRTASPGRLRAARIHQQIATHLAGGVAGQLREELDPPRHLVARQPLAHERAHLGGVERRA